MEENGFKVEVRETTYLTEIRNQYQVPSSLYSCHTVIVDDYVIEGHVPVTEINQLLAERPDVIGLAVPGMPIGSPGMESLGASPQPYDVFSFDKLGNTHIFATYSNE